MRILVAGASGFLGRHIVRALQERGGHELVGMSREARPGSGIQWVVGDVKDPASLERATAGIDCVVHTVQFPNHPVENPGKGWTYLEVDGQGTVNMVAAAVRSGVKRFVYLSGAGTREGRPERWFRAKWMAEEAIRKSGMEWVILRPSWVYGPDDHGMNRFVTFARTLPFIPVIGDGKARMQPIHVDDVARVASLAVDLPAATNRVFELGGPRPLTMDEILHTLLGAMGVRKPLVHHPVGLMKAAAGLIQHLPKAPLSPGAIDFLTMDEPLDPRPAEDAFGFRFRALEEGLDYLK